jgi:diguanylate cyclase
MPDPFAGPTPNERPPLSETCLHEARRTNDDRIGHPNPTTNRLIRVVLVEDDDDYVLLVTKMLRDAFGHHFELEHADHLGAARRTVRAKDVDCLLLDLRLPDARGLEALRALQETAPDVPIVVLSGHEDETLAIEAVQAGAQDYLVKGYLDAHRLSRAIRYAIVRKRSKLGLARQAVEDPLTGLPNRRLFDDHLRVALERSQRRESCVAVLFLDLDRFKRINDGFGHQTGDRLLVEVARRLASIARPYDTFARFGGDEFMLLLDDVTRDDVVFTVADRLIEAVSEPFLVDGDDVFVGLSIGIAFSHGWQMTPEMLVRNADQAMYLAKERASGYEVFGREAPVHRPYVTKATLIRGDVSRRADTAA